MVWTGHLPVSVCTTKTIRSLGKLPTGFFRPRHPALTFSFSYKMPLQLGLNVRRPISGKSKASSRKPPAALGENFNPEGETPSRQVEENGPTRTAQFSRDFTTVNNIAHTAKPPFPVNSTIPQQSSSSVPKSKSRDNVETAPSLSSTLAAKKITTDAEAQDSTIFDYDAHFSTSSSAALAAQRRTQAQREAQERKPKYMMNMQAAASQRKRDYMRAEDKKLQREREEDPEGETEAFVTGAYKARQEEVRRLDSEERAKEKEEEENREKSGMGGFWRGVWDEDEKRRAEQVEDGEEQLAGSDGELEKEKELADKAKQLNEQGANIQINEEGLVTDKRQLLKGGLNVAIKGKGVNSAPEKERAKAESNEAKINEWNSREKREARRAIGERHARMVEQQMDETKKRNAEEEAADLQKKDLAIKSKKTDKDISSAKERYLQRKREAEEAKRLGIEE